MTNKSVTGERETLPSGVTPYRNTVPWQGTNGLSIKPR